MQPRSTGLWKEYTLERIRPNLRDTKGFASKVEEKCFPRKPPSSPGRRLISRHDVLICELNSQLWRHINYEITYVFQIYSSSFTFDLLALALFWLCFDWLCSDCLMPSQNMMTILIVLTVWLCLVRNVMTEKCLIHQVWFCFCCFASNMMTQKNVWLCWAQYDDTTNVWLPDDHIFVIVTVRIRAMMIEKVSLLFHTTYNLRKWAFSW